MGFASPRVPGCLRSPDRVFPANKSYVSSNRDMRNSDIGLIPGTECACASGLLVRDANRWISMHSSQRNHACLGGLNRT